MLKNKIIACLLALSSFGLAHGQQIEKPGIKSSTTFAIVIDSETYRVAREEVIAYKNAIEQDGLGTYILVDEWKNPEAIRTELLKLHQQKSSPLEGVVLVGAIPIPMIRDAQYLTSAFKMNQKIRWDKSSVPSDRYYDDFDLQFDFLRQDTTKGREHYFYYSLKPASTQFIEMDIYSARIKPPIEAGEDPKPKIKEYLQKVVRLRKEDNRLSDMIVSTGHGYNSNSINAVSGEALALKSQFPDLFKPGNSIKFLNYRNAEFIKFNLLSELKRPGLDFAYMTGHGTATLQLLNGYPEASAPQPSMANVARYLRSKMRNAKEDGRDTAQVKEGFKTSLGVNEKWFTDAFDPSSIAEDSIYNEHMDMQIHDIRDAGVQARLVYLNSCLTGSFHLDNYLAGYYPFSKNENITALANSIGVLQDLWPAELMGTLQHGVRVGHWLKHIAYLETHLLGDPTFSFTASTDYSLNEALVSKTNDKKYWQTLLTKNDADLQALSLVYLSRILPQEDASPLLRKYYFESPFETVRMEAFQLLRNFEDSHYFDVLHAAKTDSYEFIRRRAIYDLADFGGDDFVKDQLEFYASDPHSERIAYRTRWNLQFLNPTLAHRYIDEVIRKNPALVQASTLADKLDKDITYHAEKLEKSKATLTDTTKADKDRISEMNSLRLYRQHALIPTLISIAQDQEESAELRKTALDVMGWYVISVHRPKIQEACELILNQEKAPKEVKDEALKTKNRLRAKMHG
ncbi:hypothetical protein FAZ19_11705 [Sphingobacterium alkalisoli]|uniref:HEAT repeat domain-containing protein n=1 Tax=Sphingobacterium alkalisoli TaxID=1874115 RepID=A0A4U0H2B9_9SPHI|nr:hypothetical protein [Sphingobacterium alkalisoli]TJY65777.1 hypothetical protein FAZ19_11705 [Sphingobacterium alkalisoli]GGH18380.1 hypothetical protein GCM10011418_21970 [Sphingobacterium alkalisoli]